MKALLFSIKLMSLFIFLFLAAPSAWATNQDAEHVVFYLQKHQFSKVENELEQLRLKGGKDSEGHSRFAETTAYLGGKISNHWKSFMPDVDAWCEASPKSYLPYLIRGNAYKERAWIERGSKTADQIPDGQIKLFEQALLQALKDYKQAFEINPRVSQIYTEQISLFMAIGEREKAFEQFKQAIARDPDAYEAYNATLSLLTPRWGGSKTALFEFARKAAVRHPDDPLYGMLILQAHLDTAQTLFYRSQESGAHPEEYDKILSDYFSDPQVWNEVVQICEEYSNKYKNSAKGHNWLSYLGTYAKKNELVCREMLLVGKRVDAPWKNEFEFNRVLAAFRADFPQYFIDVDAGSGSSKK